MKFIRCDSNTDYMKLHLICDIIIINYRNISVIFLNKKFIYLYHEDRINNDYILSLCRSRCYVIVLFFYFRVLSTKLNEYKTIMSFLEVSLILVRTLKKITHGEAYSRRNLF